MSEFSYYYSKIIESENEVKYLIKLNFANSFNYKPLLKIEFNSNIIDNENFCKFYPNPTSL